MQPDPRDHDEPKPTLLEYNRGSMPRRTPDERGAWLGLIITLVVCFVAAIAYFAFHG
jgi:hypothetical protein